MVTGYGVPRRRRVGTSWTGALAAFLLVAVVAVPVGAGASSEGCGSPAHGLAVPARAEARPLHLPPGGDDGHRFGGHHRLDEFVHAALGPKVRLLLRLPDGLDREDEQRRLAVQPAELAAAASQASRFSQVCRVWAPMYRQATVYALSHGASPAPTCQHRLRQFASGWRDYIRHDNDGRPIVFIGHSQGAAMLIRLLRTQIDPSRALRKQLVSAIILGGNVQVPTGRRRRRELPTHPDVCLGHLDRLCHRLFDLRLRPTSASPFSGARAAG